MRTEEFDISTHIFRVIRELHKKVKLLSPTTQPPSTMTTALLIIDMQRYFVDMTTTALPNIQRLSSHFLHKSHPQIFTQHGHTREELTPPFTNQLVKKWGPGGSIARGSRDWELLPQIKDLYHKARDQDMGISIVDKNTYDAFINTALEKTLRDRGVQRVVVCGVMTDCCCDTTARSAFNRGFETWLVSDATGSANQTQHQAGLRGFGFAFGEVLTTKEVLKRLA